MSIRIEIGERYVVMRNSAMHGLMRMVKKNRCLRMRRRLTCMVMLLALHVLSIFPRSTGKNTVKDR